METTFATVVDKILKDCADSAKEYEDGSLVFSTDVTELMRSLDI